MTNGMKFDNKSYKISKAYIRKENTLLLLHKNILDDTRHKFTAQNDE